MSKKKGFTLAEIIITLTIVGVIAAMTIPPIVTNIQDQQYRTAWKKAYSTLDQTTRMIISSKGSMKNVCLVDRSNCLMNLYKQYLSSIKTCTGGTGTLLGNCWHFDNTWKYLNGSLRGDWDGGDAGMILNNGILLDFYFDDPNCKDDRSLNNDGTYLICAQIVVDINGFSKPNIIGKDIFSAWIREDRLAPKGADGDKYSPATCDRNSSWGCSAFNLYQ